MQSASVFYLMHLELGCAMNIARTNLWNLSSGYPSRGSEVWAVYAQEGGKRLQSQRFPCKMRLSALSTAWSAALGEIWSPL